MKNKEKNITIEIKDMSFSFLHKKRNTLEVLSNITLSISKGEFVAIVGPSGCGKTTLLRIIGGLLKPLDKNVNLYGSIVVN